MRTLFLGAVAIWGKPRSVLGFRQNKGMETIDESSGGREGLDCAKFVTTVENLTRAARYPIDL